MAGSGSGSGSGSVGWGVLGAVVFAFGVAVPLAGQEYGTGARAAGVWEGGTATLADFAWLEGVWLGGGPEDGPATAVNETHYMAPAAGVIPGMMRLWDGEKLMVLEFFDIVAGESGLEMRLRHFDARLRAWETDGPLVLHLVGYDGHRSVWATAEDAELQIRSEIVPGSDRYHTRTVITRPDGSEQVIENVMKRK